MPSQLHRLALHLPSEFLFDGMRKRGFFPSLVFSSSFFSFSASLFLPQNGPTSDTTGSGRKGGEEEKTRCQCLLVNGRLLSHLTRVKRSCPPFSSRDWPSASCRLQSPDSLHRERHASDIRRASLQRNTPSGQAHIFSNTL